MILDTTCYNVLGGPHYSLRVDDVLTPHNEIEELAASYR